MEKVEDIHTTRTFAAGRASFVVLCPSDELRSAVEELFKDLDSPDDSDTITAVLLGEDEDGGLTVDIGGGAEFMAQRPNAALTSMVTGISRLSLDAEPARLHLHCAGLVRNGRGALISAASETGKTTIAAGLALRGWTYVSDEAIAFEAGSPVGIGYSKPLIIKPGGGDLVPELEAVRVRLGSDDEVWWHVPASAIPAPIEQEITPSLVVVLFRDPDGSLDRAPVPTPMHPADAVVALMGQTMDAGRFGTEAVVVLAQVAAQCRCVAMPVGPLDDAVSLLEDLIVADPVLTEVRVLDSGAGADGWHVPSAVRSVIIGERAVVHDTAGGGIAALDEAGTAVWRAVHGEAPEWWQPEALQSAGVIGFLEQLASHAMVEKQTLEERTGAP